MNSWQQPDSNIPSVGTLHLLDEADRNGSWDLDDSSVSTSWETADFSEDSRVPGDAWAFYGLCQVHGGTNVSTDLWIRHYGSSETSATRLRTLFCKDEEGSAFANGIPIIIIVRDGQFQYRAYASAAVDRFLFNLWGYYL